MRFSKWLVAVILGVCGLGCSPTRQLLFAQEANNAAPQPTDPAINYTLPKDGEVTLGIYDQQGQLLRTVVSGESRSQGKLSESWDGLDQWGKPIPAGSYMLKGLYHPTITTNYVMTFGNPGNPPWPTSDGKGDWLGDESAPQAVASDGQWVFLAAPGAEKGSNIIALDATGQRQWGAIEPFAPATVSLAVDGEYLYALFSGPQLTDSTRSYHPGGANATGRAILVCLDKRTGHAAKFTINTPIKVIAKFAFTGTTVGLWDLRSQKTYSPANYSGQPRYGATDVGETTDAIGLAVANERIYVAMHDDNQILVFDANTGSQVDQIPVPGPAGLFAEANHSILAVSNQHVVRINPANKQIQTVVSAGLVAPKCVTEDQKNRIYVSDWGSSFQVKVFSASGTPQRSIGEEGGRPWVGKWDNNGMLVPTGIAVAGDGKLWVAEDDSSPRRVSVWNPDTGAFVKEYLGPTPYGGPGSMIDPKDPTDANGMGTRFKISFSAKTWTPRAVMERRMNVNQPFAMNGAASPSPGQKVLYHNGDEYQTVMTGAGIAIHKRKGDLLVPVAAIGSLRAPDTGDGTSVTIWDSDLGRREVANFYPPFFSGHAGSNYTWTDSNGDGLAQAGEMQWLPALSGNDSYAPGSQPLAFTYWGFGIGDDWSIYWSGSYKSQSFIFRLDVKGWTPEGAPIYDIHDSKPIIVRSRALEPSGLFAAADGKVVATYSYEAHTSPNAIECFDRNGKSLWGLAMPKPPPAGPGEGPKDILAQNVITEFKVPGIGNVLGSWLWHANVHPYLFTDDGLYVASLLEETHNGPNAAWDESFKSYYQDPQGVPYIINGGNDAFHVLRIDGLNKGGRFEQPFTYTQQDFAKAAAFRLTPVPKAAPKPILNVTWAAQPPAIDGKLNDWNMRAGAALQGAKNRGAQIALTRDASNLYLAYQVTKDRPFSNKGDNWQTLFLSGDCVDLMLSTDAASGLHSDPAAGDIRLLFSMYQGKPVAVLYRPVVSGTAQPMQLMAARIDSIRQLSSAKVAIVPSGNSYIVEAAVPLSDIGVDPKASGVALRGDVGVIYADASGTSRALRLYYYNKQTSVTADLTTEATLQPSQWGTVQLPLGNNLLRDSSFENGFTATQDLGWFKATEQNDATASMTAVSPHSGMQSLMLQQVKPVVYSDAAIAGADYHAFLVSANNGAGAGVAMVEQRVPVKAGHLYSFRFNFRADKLQVEKQTPGPGRGASNIGVLIEWSGTGIAAPQRYTGVLDNRVDSADWKQETNSSSSYQLIPKPYLAPAGATAAIVRFRLGTNTANDLPTVFIDDVELVDVTAGP
jgi:hypothetical protein